MNIDTLQIYQKISITKFEEEKNAMNHIQLNYCNKND